MLNLYIVPSVCNPTTTTSETDFWYVLTRSSIWQKCFSLYDILLWLSIAVNVFLYHHKDFHITATAILHFFSTEILLFRATYSTYMGFFISHCYCSLEGLCQFLVLNLQVSTQLFAARQYLICATSQRTGYRQSSPFFYGQVEATLRSVLMDETGVEAGSDFTNLLGFRMRSMYNSISKHRKSLA